MGSFPHLPVTSEQDSTANFERLIEALTDSGWIKPTLEHSWAAGPVEPAYRRKWNLVRVRGRVKSGESAKSAFTLPEGFRPLVQVYVPAMMGSANVGYLVVEPSGTVTPTVGAGSEPSFDGLTFYVD